MTLGRMAAYPKFIRVKKAIGWVSISYDKKKILTVGNYEATDIAVEITDQP